MQIRPLMTLSTTPVLAPLGVHLGEAGRAACHGGFSFQATADRAVVDPQPGTHAAARTTRRWLRRLAGATAGSCEGRVDRPLGPPATSGHLVTEPLEQRAHETRAAIAEDLGGRYAGVRLVTTWRRSPERLATLWRATFTAAVVLRPDASCHHADVISDLQQIYEDHGRAWCEHAAAALTPILVGSHVGRLEVAWTIGDDSAAAGCPVPPRAWPLSAWPAPRWIGAVDVDTSGALTDADSPYARPEPPEV